jgi:hypothetical protein
MTRDKQFILSYLIHIGSGNLHSIEYFAFEQGIDLTANQIRKYISLAIHQSKSKNKIKNLNQHSL